MLFDSLAFAIALPLFSAVFLTAPARVQPALALIASLAACATFGWVSLTWLVALTLFGYVLGRSFTTPRSGAWLGVGLLVLFAPLLVLKYTNFALTSLQSALAWWGVSMAAPQLHATLPIGISFYSFVLAGYLIDVHLGRIPPERDLCRFALLTTFYPKLVAGPVERAAAFLPQIGPAKRFDYARLTDGARIIGAGLFKKLVVADRLAVVVNNVYAHPGAYRGLTLALTAVLYMFQLYYDFCGYSEIAVGTARILGYELTWNFNRPYAARSISDYWRRWHISLTSWFFEYIFAPVAVALRSWQGAAVVIAMMTTFLVSGLWHGARWTFVLYGLLHGAALCVDFLSAGRRKRLRAFVPVRLYAFVAWAVTFTFVACADVLFRAGTLREAAGFLRHMLGGIGPDLGFLWVHRFSPASLKALLAGLPMPKIDLVIALVSIACIEIAGLLGRRQPLRERLLRWPAWMRWGVYYLVAGAIVYLGSQNTATVFIYQQF